MSVRIFPNSSAVLHLFYSNNVELLRELKKPQANEFQVSNAKENGNLIITVKTGGRLGSAVSFGLCRVPFSEVT